DEQIALFNFVFNAGVTNDASVNNNVLQYAKGNIGLNVAAGSNNQQANAAALADAQSSDGAAASIGAVQVSGVNGTINVPAWLGWEWEDEEGHGWFWWWFQSTTNTASMNDNALQYVSGNVGVNIAAGDGNQQKNDLAIANASGCGTCTVDGGSDASTWAFQGTFGNGTFNYDTYNTASMNNYAMQYASGNIGVNIAAGSGNQQFNGLSLATAQY
ncbi:MAG: hypothetical protein ACYC05_15300, partial [Sulfuricella sp.]